MATTPAGADQIATERCCKRISLLTEQQYELVKSDKNIVLIGREGQAGCWNNWHEARVSLESSVKIVERAFLEIVLLGDNSSGKNRLKAIERELTEAKEELAIARIDLKYLKKIMCHYVAQEKR